MNEIKPKSAKEMFKDLGYEYSKSSEYITYTKKYMYGEVDLIEFDLEFKTFNMNCQDCHNIVDMNELDAIIRQCKELNWL